MHKRVSLDWHPQRGYFVNLPTYTIVAGTFLPLHRGIMHRDGPTPTAEPADVLAINPTVIVLTPIEDCLTEDQQVCPIKIAEKYRGNDQYDTADYKPPRLHDFQPLELQPPKEMTLFERIQHVMHIGK